MLNALKICMKHNPSMIVIMTIHTICQAGFNLFLVLFFMRYTIDALVSQPPLNEIVLFIVLSAIVFTALSLESNWYESVYKPIANQRLSKVLSLEVFSKAITLDIVSYESEAFYNDYELVLKEYPTRIIQILNSIQFMGENIVRLIGMAGYVFIIDKMLLAMVPVITAAVWFLQRLHNKISNEYTVSCIPYERRMVYTNRILTMPNYAMDMRTTNVYDLGKRYFTEAIHQLDRLVNRNGAKLASLSFLISFTGTYLPALLSAAYLSYAILVERRYDIQEYVAIMAAIMNVTSGFIQLINQNKNISQNKFFMNKATAFLALTSVLKRGNRALPASVDQILIDDVDFIYAGSKKDALSGINMCIKKGEKIAVVGENGAGKSTLIKLLMHLYEPISGVITLNGNDIAEFPLEDYRRLYGTMFQEHNLYAISIADNVKMGASYSVAQVEEALRKAGILDKINQLPNGINTVWSNEFSENGVNFSGGEVQLILFARLLIKDASIIIMDEPDSALDAIFEKKLFDIVYNTMTEKTVLFISHHLSSVVKADRIYVMENGKIVESGTHENLLHQNGLYARMFKSQSQKYIKKAAKQNGQN